MLLVLMACIVVSKEAPQIAMAVVTYVGKVLFTLKDLELCGMVLTNIIPPFSLGLSDFLIYLQSPQNS